MRSNGFGFEIFREGHAAGPASTGLLIHVVKNPAYGEVASEVWSLVGKSSGTVAGTSVPASQRVARGNRVWNPRQRMPGGSWDWLCQ